MIVVTERANEREKKKIEGEMRVRHGVRDRDWEMCENETDSTLVHIRGYCSIIVKNFTIGRLGNGCFYALMLK